MLAILLLLLKLCVSGQVFAIGLASSHDQVLYLWRRPALLLRSVLAMYLVIPVLVLVAVLNLPLPPELRTALVVLAISAGAPLLPRKLMDLGDGGFAFSLAVLASALAMLTVPAWIWIIAVLSKRELTIDLGGVARVLATSFLLPLVAGLLLRRWLPDLAQRLATPLLMGIGLLFLACALLLLVLSLPLLAGAGWLGFVMLAVLTALALLVGHLMGGPDPAHRTSLAVCCATRHVGLAALIAATVTGQRTIAFLLAYVVASALVVTPYLRWRRGVLKRAIAVAPGA